MYFPFDTSPTYSTNILVEGAEEEAEEEAAEEEAIRFGIERRGPPNSFPAHNYSKRGWLPHHFDDCLKEQSPRLWTSHLDASKCRPIEFFQTGQKESENGSRCNKEVCLRRIVCKNFPLRNVL